MDAPTNKHLRRTLSRLRPAILSALLLLGLGQFISAFGQRPSPDATAATDNKPVPGRGVFKQQATLFVSEFCVKCHGELKQEGDLRLDTVLHDMADDKTARLWNDIFAQVQFSEMPPSDSKQQPTAARKKEFLKQVEAELMRVGRGFGLDKKMLLPQFGNYVDHKSLFDGSVKVMPYTPARLWRQRPIIYDAIWANAYGRAPWYSVKIGGTGNHLIKQGPHKGKLLAHRYFADAKYANPFFEFVHHASGFTDYASIVADQSSLEALLVNAETMAQILTVGQKVRIVTQVKNKGSRTGNNEAMFVGGVTTSANEYRGRVPVIFQKILNTNGAVARKDFNQALDVAFALFLRRSPREEEYESYWNNVFQKNVELGNKMALQAVLIFVTLSPEFVYRMELGLGIEDEHGRRLLSPQELTYAIHYAFHNKPAFGVPEIDTVDVYTKDSEAPIKRTMSTSRPAWAAGHSSLVREMQAGKLKTRADVERVVRKMFDARQNGWLTNHNRTFLSTPNPRILQFFREFFGYYKAREVFKDVDKFKQREGFKQFISGTASKFEYDTDSLIRHILQEDKNVLYELLTTNKVVASYWNGTNPEDRIKRARGKETYRITHHLQNYNLDPFELAYDKAKSQDALVRQNGKVFRVPEEQRCGILTQPSWLVAHSGNFDNDPVRRGKWIREKLLAGVVMDVPITVDAQIPDDETKTLRERFSVVHADECWRCHKKMNPLGMPFEAFNHVGRWRSLEKGKPVNTKGGITHTGDTSLDSGVENVREMMERLAKSDLVRQSFIRHVFRYWMGRNEMMSDSRTLIAMDKAYVESDGSFKELLVSLLTSDSFLYRK
ncbi:MAG: DUF1588 domain-containing protein [Planctomycetaceae bacterium]|jgi:hypothetical protein|nr:DUF1588 domain-containing protein [Planctomycetaceae bacterium]MBT6156913.1 DUF1588 domain-containing protein [Planctomycetaceae bacterium]MBT6496130.1 DUF1588 domain-containing protein [Planctomycetaceae bacterium]